ncbi:MAG: hypothetical protein ACYCQJ_13925 [Nitrososphaerales archaeon]
MSLREEEKVNKAENAWLPFVNSRQYQPDFVKLIIKNSTIKYGGSYYLAPKAVYAKSFITVGNEDVNFDVVYLDRKGNSSASAEYGLHQTIFYGLDDLFSIRKITGKSVFLFGELHDSQGSVHWNIFILNRSETLTVEWFDPVGPTNDFTSRDRIISSLQSIYGKVLERPYICDEAPQYVCEPNTLGMDRFCQTWVLLFLELYVHGQAENFLHLQFTKYQTQILKYWLLPFLKTHGYWKDITHHALVPLTGEILPASVFSKWFSTCVQVTKKLESQNEFRLIKMSGRVYSPQGLIETFC